MAIIVAILFIVFLVGFNVALAAGLAMIWNACFISLGAPALMWWQVLGGMVFLWVIRGGMRFNRSKD